LGPLINKAAASAQMPVNKPINKAQLQEPGHQNDGRQLVDAVLSCRHVRDNEQCWMP
jgi:hypothetical protein